MQTVILRNSRKQYVVFLGIGLVFVAGGLFLLLVGDKEAAWIAAVNAFRLIVGAAEVLHIAEQVGQADTMDLHRYRSWYRTKQGPSLFDIRWAVREHLLARGSSRKAIRINRTCR